MLSANCELAEFIEELAPFLGDFGHVCNRRTAMRPRREHLEISPAALRDYFHATVRAIARPALESEPISLVCRGAAKEHALHAARYEHAKPCVVIGITHGRHSWPSRMAHLSAQQSRLAKQFE